MATKASRALRTIAGGDASLEEEDVNSSTRVLYTTKGLLLLSVSLLSAAVAGYTWSEVFHSSFVGVMVGCLWFIVSLTLNMIISWKFDQVSIHGTSRWHALPVAVVLGLVIASVNSQFILMRIYDSEIKAHIAEKHRSERAAKEAELTTSVSAFAQKASELREKAEADKQVARANVESALTAQQAEVSQLRKRYDEAVKALTTEIEGKAVTGRVGDGSVAGRKRQEMAEVKALLDASTVRLEQARARLNPQVDQTIQSIEAALATSLQDLERQKKANEGYLTRDARELETAPRDGFLQRSAALTAVAWQQPVWAGLFFLLFAILESTVVLLKALTGQTEYHLLRRVELARLVEKHGKELETLDAANRERARLGQDADMRRLEEGGATHEQVNKARQRLLRSVSRN